MSAQPGARFARNAHADSRGRFAFDSVPAGQYMVAFHHPMLDTIGIASGTQEIRVTEGRDAHVDLAIPSASRIRSAVCNAAELSDAGGIVLGTVRRASDQSPLGGATVTGDWQDIAVTRAGVQRLPRRVTAKSGNENGRFAMCNVPKGGSMTLRAAREGDSTARIEIQVPADGFVRRDLYLGGTRSVVSGSVVTREDTPIVGARLTVLGSGETLTNEHGEFTLANVESGTRMLEVRALGFYPDVRAINLLPGSPPLRITLTTMKAVLDTIRVKATALTSASGFEERHRANGGGHFITEKQIATLNPKDAEELFQNAPTVRIAPGNMDARS